MLRDLELAVVSVLSPHWKGDKLPCSKLGQLEKFLLLNLEPAFALGLPDAMKFNKRASTRIVFHL